MFDPTGTPRVFREPPGVDFPAALVAGLRDRLRGQPPEAMARVLLFVNTAQMRRQVVAAFQRGGAGFLPRIRLVSDLRLDTLHDDLPEAGNPLAERLALVQIVRGLLDTGADFVPSVPPFDLADSLAALLAEMEAEGVAPEALDALDVTDESGHWRRALQFLRIVVDYRQEAGLPPVAEAHQRAAAEALARRWQAAPPDTPVIVAGSTGSRGATALLMRAVADLPQGAIVLPGFDDAMPAAAWDDLQDALSGEDHPQFRFARLLSELGLTRAQVGPWSGQTPAHPARNAALSLALRPAPVTDCWLTEGPQLTDIAPAFATVALVEAESRRQEALAIACRLRLASETGQSAALVTPDRLLAREVTSALDRWDITPDDSAGVPLHLTPPGRFVLHVAALLQGAPAPTDLLELLKHPLTHSGAPRGPHLRMTRDLELWLRRNGHPHPDAALLARWAEEQAARHPQAARWAAWIGATILADPPADGPLDATARALAERAEAIAAGPDGAGAGELWDKKAGAAVQATLADLATEGGAVDLIPADEMFALLHTLLSGQNLREIREVAGHIAILGPQEIRARSADLVILAGLNEGTWPASPPPDPWLNRQMRHQAGLLLPERRIGLSAHDFQQAVAAREVWITRAKRSDEAETVPSRWLNRLLNLLGGLDALGGPQVVTDMQARGAAWLAEADALDIAPPPQPARRPSPRPPVEARPRTLAVTRIATLIRDPYAIYARYILGLKPLDPLDRAPDALLRGIVVHEVLEAFLRAVDNGDAPLTADALLAMARDRLAEQVPWPSTRALWMARMARVAPWFVDRETALRATQTPIEHEAEGRAQLSDPPFTLFGRADRIDRDGDGLWHLYDYKTGTPPSAKQQKHFDKQLPLLAAIAEYGSFDRIGSGRVARAAYVGLGTNPKEAQAPLDETPPAQVWEGLAELVSRFDDPAMGYTARRRTFTDRESSDYDHLSRFGEWDPTDDPNPEDVG